jgi:hypothetical protein
MHLPSIKSFFEKQKKNKRDIHVNVSRRGSAGDAAACMISDAGEWFDQTIKGDPASASRTKQQTPLVAVTRAHQVAVMWFAAFTDRTAYLLDIDGDELVKKRTVWILVAVAVVVAIAWWASGQLRIDSCLDSGGRWNYELGICER